MQKILKLPQATMTVQGLMLARLIRQIDARHYEVETQDGEVRYVERCAGCLLEPEVDDQVLVGMMGSCVLLIQVVRQAHPEQKTIAAETLKLNARVLDLQAKVGTLHINRLNFISKRINAQVAFLKTLGTKCVSYFKNYFSYQETLMHKAALYRLETELAQESCAEAKILETPAYIQKTELQQINTQNFRLNS